ncbi:hypothetical protein PV10_00012 [Exophiala mesophila]|uniref:Transcription initiation protein spt3 n=1 Tax=Exophiala mesophila TaxID=212818 RepID=A0A0D2AB11_EXOME|nr:uncharacterized protein PV10_00012 [Exophiala mesophila]KIV96108.1 hypothetical protein PV10_00012 [Exophiala mesophila]
MFIGGETAQPDSETTALIEAIVKEQVIEMILQALNLANRRGIKTVSIVDIAFQMRHNCSRIARLKNFLYWKDIRKNAKDSDDRATDEVIPFGDGDQKESGQGYPSKSQPRRFNHTARIAFPWEDPFLYSEQPPEMIEDEVGQEEGRQEMLIQLALADYRTSNMTKDEYAYWSDCRQASFTFRKAKRFRRWVGLDRLVESKVSDDVIDVLGFLISEIIKTLTKEAISVKEANDRAEVKDRAAAMEEVARKRQDTEPCGLFSRPHVDTAPVSSKHIQEAYRRLQVIPKKYTCMRLGASAPRASLRLI